MLIDLIVVSTTINVLIILFGHFEAYTPVWRRLLKLVFLLGGTAGLSALAGHWSLLLLIATMLVGGSYHTWWCRKNGIDPVTAAPRPRFEELMKARYGTSTRLPAA